MNICVVLFLLFYCRRSNGCNSCDSNRWETGKNGCSTIKESGGICGDSRSCQSVQFQEVDGGCERSLDRRHDSCSCVSESVTPCQQADHGCRDSAICTERESYGWNYSVGGCDDTCSTVRSRDCGCDDTCSTVRSRDCGCDNTCSTVRSWDCGCDNTCSTMRSRNCGCDNA